jgi:hypoxanthine phosphoribosyltransferase
MKNNKYFLTWNKYQELVEGLAKKISRNREFSAVFGIPRGGLPIAVSLSHLLNIPLITKTPKSGFKKILVVDDISDTGNAMNMFNKYTTAAIFIKPATKHVPDFYMVETTKWVVFPWETEKTSKYDNI